MLKNTRQLSSATSIFKNLKLKIASSLTSSLSQKDRTILLQTLNINVDGEGHKELEAQKDELEKKGAVPDKSIGEAVAAAVAKEAAKNKELSQKKIDEIWKRAEEATTERLKNDLLIQERKLAMKRWEMELEEEKNRLVREEKDQSLGTGNVNALPIGETQDVHHPILGKAIVDLGYKRVHLVSAKSLSSIPIWEKQRVYRHDRAKEMAADKMKSLSLGLPGVIAIHETNDGDLSILDGQHRVGMMTILQELIQKKGDEEESNLLDLAQILVEVFPQSFSPHYTSEDHHAKDIFTEINKAEPVAVLDLPGVAKGRTVERKIINQASSELQQSFPEMFKPSQRCRVPHVNVDNLRDAIFGAGIIQKHNIKNKSALIKYLLDKNEELGDLYRSKDSFPRISTTALKKARTHGFFLGMDSSWLYKS